MSSSLVVQTGSRPYRRSPSSEVRFPPASVPVRRRRPNHIAGPGDPSVVRAATRPPVAAWVDARTELDLVELVAAGDALLKASLTTLEELQGAASSASGRGCRLLRRAAELVRERVDSIPETRVRLCLVLAGLPEPRCNVVLGDADRLIGRVDLLLEEYGLIIEYDGDQHRDSGQWNADLDRDDAFTSATFTTIRVTRRRMRQPRQLVTKIHARLVERGYVGPPPDFSAEWRRLFERRE